jgi:hypothetical protein
MQVLLALAFSVACGSNITISDVGATIVAVEEQTQIIFSFDGDHNLAIVLLPEMMISPNLVITNAQYSNHTWDAPESLAFTVLDGTEILIGADMTGIATIWIVPKSVCPGDLQYIVTFQYVIGNWVFEKPHEEPICFFPENPPSDGRLILTALESREMRITFYDSNATSNRQPITAPDSLKTDLEEAPFFFRLDTITAESQFGYVIEYRDWLRHNVCKDNAIPVMDDAGFAVRPPDDDTTVGLACSNENSVLQFMIFFSVIVGIVGLILLAAMGLCLWRRSFRSAKARKNPPAE